jgi:hypothetical protein
MEDTKPRTLWAFASLVCGILGSCGLVAFGLLATLHPFSDTTGVTLGLWIVCLVFPSSVLCLMGVIFGFVALLRIRSGQYGGRWGSVDGNHPRVFTPGVDGNDPRVVTRMRASLADGPAERFFVA